MITADDSGINYTWKAIEGQQLFHSIRDGALGRDGTI